MNTVIPGLTPYREGLIMIIPDLLRWLFRRKRQQAPLPTPAEAEQLVREYFRRTGRWS